MRRSLRSKLFIRISFHLQHILPLLSALEQRKRSTCRELQHKVERIMNAILRSVPDRLRDALPGIDHNPAETAEWRDAFLSLVAADGPQRAGQILDELCRLARHERIGWQ
ncbi:MAG: hypothetical protein KDH48_10750, partial [Rhodoferax sp.]|nr:hypothetical protein [Rhodoferax sp.]